MAVSEEFFVKVLANDLAVLGQRMDHVSSAAMMILVPAGASHDPADSPGTAAIASEWCLRGAGDRDTRQLNDALDSLGCQHGETVLSDHIQFAAAQLGRNLPDVLAIYRDILRRPRLEDAAFQPCRELALQDLNSLEDNPKHKCSVLLEEKFYPYPLGRSSYGTVESLQAMSAESVREQIAAYFSPRRTILAVAGSFDWGEFCELVERHFGDWPAGRAVPPATKPPAGGITHVSKDSAQQHIAMAHRAATLSDPRYYAVRVAEKILSGGMSGRLFTEVREKRGLVYHVSCRYHSLKHHAGMFTYAGTVPQRAAETFEVTVNELRRLADGITTEELARAKTQLKSDLIMQGESTSARAGALAGDWYHLGRLRTLEEISEAVDKISVEDVLAYLRDFPADDFTILVIGPEQLKTSGK